MRWIALSLVSLFPALAQERLTVLNAASQTGNGTAAPGSMLLVNLIPAPNEPFPTLGPSALNVTILANGMDFAMECEIVPASFAQFLNPLEVVVMLPSTLPLGPAQLTLYHSGVTATALVTIVASNLGLFPSSSGFAIEQSTAGQAPGPNQLTHPAQPGDTVTLWATGLGAAAQVTVLLGAVPVTATSAGPAPGMPGVDQIQFTVPDNPVIPDDCYVAVQVQAAGITSNTISISKTSDGSACQSTLGLTEADLATLDGGGTVGVADLTISASVSAPLSRVGDFLVGTAAPQGFARIESANFTALAENASGVAAIAGTVVAEEAVFGCATPPPGPSAEAGSFAVFGAPYNFGNQVSLQGSGGTLTLSALLGGFPFIGEQTSPTVPSLSLLAPPLFSPGMWTFSGNGGTGAQTSTTAAPFSVPITLPPEIMATNVSAVETINRQQDLMITWNPAGFGELDVLTVALNGAPFPVVPQALAVTGTLVAICRTPATVGQIVIPAALLQALPPSIAGGPPTASVNLSVAPRLGPTQTFSLPLADGSMLAGVLEFTSSESWPVTVE